MIEKESNRFLYGTALQNIEKSMANVCGSIRLVMVFLTTNDQIIE